MSDKKRKVDVCKKITLTEVLYFCVVVCTWLKSLSVAFYLWDQSPLQQTLVIFLSPPRSEIKKKDTQHSYRVGVCMFMVYSLHWQSCVHGSNSSILWKPQLAHSMYIVSDNSLEGCFVLTYTWIITGCCSNPPILHALQYFHTALIHAYPTLAFRQLSNEDEMSNLREKLRSVCVWRKPFKRRKKGTDGQAQQNGRKVWNGSSSRWQWHLAWCAYTWTWNKLD